MSRYDNDDAVVALLREAVPPVPDVADRVTAIRAKASRQRAALWTQALGAVASVLLIVGVAAAVGTSSGREAGPVAPVDDPIATGIKAFDTVGSLRFEVTTAAVGTPSLKESRISEAQIKEILNGRIVGAAERDGDLQVDGDLSPFLMLSAGEHQTDFEYDFHFRIVDGQSYRSVMPGEPAPDGKTWVAEEGDSQSTGDDLTRWLRIGSAFADDVEYIGPATVRDEPVAEYRFTVPEKVTRSEDVEVTFALDAEGRVRRVATEVSWASLLVMLAGGERSEAAAAGPGDAKVRFELLLYGFDEPVTVSKPPAGETATSEQISGLLDAESRQFSDCLQAANNDHAAAEKCFEAHGSATGRPQDCTTETKPDGSKTTTCGNGTYSEVVIGEDPSMTEGSGWTEYPPGSPPPGSVMMTLEPSPVP